MREVLAAFAMSYSCDCVETKISLTYCIYIDICYCSVAAMLMQVCGCVVLHCCYAVVMRLLLLCCCCAVAMRLCCCCLSLNVFSFYALAFHGISFAKIVYGWGLFRETSISLVRVWLKSILFVRFVGSDLHWNLIFWGGLFYIRNRSGKTGVLCTNYFL